MGKIIDLLNRLSRLETFIGVDKGHHSLKIIIANRMPQGPYLNKFLIEDLTDIEEEERDSFCRNKLFDLLRGRNASSAGVFFVAKAEAVFSKRISLPSMPVREIKQALRWETKDSLPFPASEAVFDFQIVEEKQTPEGVKSLDIVAMAVHKGVIDEALLILEGTELSLENVTIIPACLINIANCMYDKYLENDKPTAFLEMGHKHSSLCIFKEKKLIFTRDLLIGSDDITNSMMTGISTEAGLVNLSYRQAEKIKLELGIPKESRLVKIEKQSLESYRLASMMAPILEKIADEINKSFIYVADKLGSPKPKKMYLLGGGALLKNIDNFFKERLNMDTEVFKLNTATSLCINIASQNQKDIVQLAPVVGAVAGEAKGINFLPFEFKKKKLELAVKILIRMLIFAVFAIFLLAYMLISFRQLDYVKRYKIMRRQQDAMYQLRESKKEIEKMDSILSAIKTNRTSAVSILQEISLRTSKDILLNNIRYSSTNDKIELQGTIAASEKESAGILSSYLKAIENSPIFQNANLVSSTQRKVAENSVLEFIISSKLETPLKKP